MPGREPRWWYGAGPHWQATLLSPLGRIIGNVAAARLRKKNSYASRLPVICIGNFTAGGSGKTPLALLVAHLVANEGREPWFLSRGYGGRLPGPIQVDPDVHGSADVGDEPLLLARRAPTVISRNRAAGAQFIEATASANAVIIMDDGLQNRFLAKNLVIAVVSGDRGLGNGRVIPAGPLRAPLATQIGLVDAIVVTGQESEANRALRDSLSALTQAPLLSATTRASEDAASLRGRRVVAYAGIANPERFFAMLESLGATVVARRAFGDHHAFSNSEARDLIDTARRMSADLVTTEKDLARFSRASGVSTELRDRSGVLKIETVIESEDLAILKAKIREAIRI
ncbi:MAG: tetraacyldisaccharide 4'-kinase [Hyphomicrobium sp.]|uniref:tetraacyldisaccharide 4'-kinase n=1 Tax=Hyphomicrobium sp. TaxID=82 RepID=UPI003565388F